MVVFMFIAIGGVALSSLIFPTIQRSIGFSNKTTILICIALEVAVPLWASLGLIFPWAGLRTKASLYSLVLTGIVRSDDSDEQYGADGGYAFRRQDRSSVMAELFMRR